MFVMRSPVMPSPVMPSLLAVLSLSAPMAAPGTGPAGHWEGSITVQGQELPIVVDLDRGSDGAWKGEIDIPVQGIRNLALESIASEATTVTFRMPGIPGEPTFQGTIAATGDSIAGELTQSGQTLPFRLTRKGAATLGAKPEGPALVEKGVPGEGVEGEWHGVLAAGPARLRLIVRVKKSGEALSGTMDSVDQGAKDLPLDAVVFDGSVMKFTLSSIGGSYQGTLAADGSSISGTWSQGGGSTPLELLRSGK
jgi:hypothetical protein